MAESWNKRERTLKKQQHKKDKAEKRLEKKQQKDSNSSTDIPLAYVDENGNLSATPPDPSKRKKINLEDIQIATPVFNPSADPEQYKGRVTYFNHAKGYGFIKDTTSQKEYFVHINELLEAVNESSEVVFSVERGPKGLMATQVSLAKK